MTQPDLTKLSNKELVDDYRYACVWIPDSGQLPPEHDKYSLQDEIYRRLSGYESWLKATLEES